LKVAQEACSRAVPDEGSPHYSAVYSELGTNSARGKGILTGHESQHHNISAYSDILLKMKVYVKSITN
jgi:hypothetical protein